MFKKHQHTNPTCALISPKLWSFLQFPTEKPVLFKTKLQNLEKEAGESVIFCCEITKPGASVVWRHDDEFLKACNKYQLKQKGTVVQLVIYKLQRSDAGEYSCDTGFQKTSAILTVNGRISLLALPQDPPLHSLSHSLICQFLFKKCLSCNLF